MNPIIPLCPFKEGYWLHDAYQSLLLRLDQKKELLAKQGDTGEVEELTELLFTFRRDMIATLSLMFRIALEECPEVIAILGASEKKRITELEEEVRKLKARMPGLLNERNGRH